MSSVNQIRQTFIDYFAKNGHQQVASGPLVPKNDPTLMFTNAGMVQFKNVFTGVEKRAYSKAVTSQKCVRAGGKHNDLDNVGLTARHLTFFEMLGNFSFGDYFKEQAIELAWNLLTKEYQVPVDKLLVTVFHEDDEAFDLWKKIAGLSEDRIIRISTSDNFWSMGDTGPCGPCSEIFYDYGDKIWGGPPGSATEDGDRFIEIWNLVFMQFDQQLDGKRINLPRPSIDTGMGLERISALLQGTNNVFETDMFKALVEGAAEVTGSASGKEQLVSQRVIADHLRSMAFLVAEGVLPSNEGRGYVLRRIMRRAMRHATLLGAKEPAIHRLLPVLSREMGQAYPELVHGEAMIGETIRLEEERFLKTLARGLQILKEETATMEAGEVLAGTTAFKLYDTYGFPLDLTEDALRAREIKVDHSGFDAAMAEQKKMARASWSGSGSMADEKIWFSVAEEIAASEFLGYASESAQGEIVALVKDGARVERLEKGEHGFVVFNQTVFYAESGGQVGDRGVLKAKDTQAQVLDVRKQVGGIFAHEVKVTTGEMALGLAMVQEVDHKRRSKIRANHSATHLLHAALRRVLGEHVVQKGSLVSPVGLRFDFSHAKALSHAEIAEIERLANEVVLQNAPVETRLMGVDEAREAGAMALFGEKYGDEVRVVSMGEQMEGDKAGSAYSMELCGGTHVRRTGDIGLIAVVQESSIASGVRRIEALSAQEARAHLKDRWDQFNNIAALLKVAPKDTVSRVNSLLAERKKLERELGEARKKLALGGGGGKTAKAENINGVKFVGRVVKDVQPRDLKGLVDVEKKSIGSGVVAIAALGQDNKVAIVVGVSDDLSEKLSAIDLVRAAARAVGGKGGGGRADMAQAGGPNGEKINAALDAVRGVLAGEIGFLRANAKES
ncbi:Alanyl-tRNA synthetase [hydrothermal vent metagenome]|uniref:Alanine--tRNA ligase n=1 Tax=hydrothermal vent metagenome TaxID=652676 RepID=A0A3B0TUY6_9ZZZZ